MFWFFYFFFSSRRRHTRCLSDWSSDVCSSDLASEATTASARPMAMPLTDASCRRAWPPARVRAAGPPPAAASGRTRSEERRVGKECRARWWREDDKEQKEGEDGEVGYEETTDL